MSECRKLVPKEYKTEHDWEGKVIDWELGKKFYFKQMVYAQPNTSPGEWDINSSGILTFKWIT